MRGETDCGHCCLDIYMYDPGEGDFYYNILCLHCKQWTEMPRTWQLTNRMSVEEHHPQALLSQAILS